MGINGRRFAEEHLSLQKCAGEVETLLQETALAQAAIRVSSDNRQTCGRKQGSR
jgi:hypothetical protein